MGLLEKSLKKSGKTRNAPAAPKPAEERPSVGWLDRSFSERTSALADKIDLEAQYARLEALSQDQVPAPPKLSLRERAIKMLTGGNAGGSQTTTPGTAVRPKRSLRERATQFMRRLSGGGSGHEGEGSSGAASGSAPSGPNTGDGGQSLQDLQEHEEHLNERTLFPWWALAGDEHSEQHAIFGDEPAVIHPEVVSESAAESAPEAASEVRSPLEDFAETISRITDNLKNLHVQLDAGNFIRDVQVEKPAQSVAGEAAASPLISHHVSVDSGPVTTTAPADAGRPDGRSAALAGPGRATKESARDVFWPRDLPLDLPARDVRVNADGTVSVVPGPFQLPYLAEDIARPDGDLSHFTRNLRNAELFIAEGELQLTRIIYERLLAKITDTEAKRKIKANLDALDNYRKSHDWGSFMPIPPWMRNNPYNDARPPQVNVSEMPVEAKNITINLDKGFFEVAKAIFELKKGFEEKKDAGVDEGHEGEIGEAEEPEGQEAEGEEGERRAGDRRQGLPDTRGEGAEERRSGEDRRAAEAEENAAPPELAADGESAANEKPEPLAEKKTAVAPEAPAAGAAAEGEPLPDGVMEPPQIPDMSPDGQAMAPGGGDDEGGGGEEKEEENKVQEIRGVLELKTPDQEDTPFLTLTYDFTKIPHAYRLAKDNGIFEYAYYKYKPMLVKAHQFIKRKQITRALNYYRVIREQQIPSEFRHMVDRNIKDITEYLQKYLVTRQN